LLDGEEVPLRIAGPVFGAPLRAVLGAAPFSVHLVGQTGTYKTTIAAVAQAFLMPTASHRRVPFDWMGTANSLLRGAHLAKDSLIVIDEYKPRGTRAQQDKLNAVVSQVLQAQGNLTGRTRLQADLTLRAADAPRGLILSTGEEVPPGESLRARMVVVDVRPGDITRPVALRLGRAARSGLFARAMAGYLRWLAGRREEWQAWLEETENTLAELLLQDLGNAPLHGRTPGQLAALSPGGPASACTRRRSARLSGDARRPGTGARRGAGGRASASGRAAAVAERSRGVPDAVA